MSFIHLIGLSRMKDTTMLSVLVITLNQNFRAILSIDDLKLYSNAISNLIAELFLLSVMSVTKKEASKILRM